MMKLVPLDTYTEMVDFPYDAPPPWRYGCDRTDRKLMDSLLYTIDAHETPDGMMCPTVYDYIACEIGRYVTPLKGE